MKTTEQKIDAKAELFISMFQFQGSIFQNALLNLTNQLACIRPSDKTNHTNWLLGHILHCRYMLANIIGIEAENPFGKLYWTAIEDKDYPNLEEITQHFPVITGLLVERLSSMSDAEFDSKPATDKPSTADIISFFIYHEAYHLGQIGYARKMIGLDALKSH